MTTSRTGSLAAVVCAALSAPLHCQGLLKNLNEFTTAPGSAPGPMARLGNTTSVVFAASVPGVGRELLVADLNAIGAQLVADLNPGIVDSNPTGLTSVGAYVLFFAQDALGSALWRTDGTPAGTLRLAMLTPYTAGVEQVIHAVGNAAFTFGSDALHGTELWYSDGTVAGTRMVVDLEPGPTGGSPGAGVVLGNELYYNWSAPWPMATRADLMRTDGTAAGTRVVVGGSVGPYVSSYRMGVTGNLVLFGGGFTNSNNWELWATDGTAAGTRLVADLQPNGSSFPDRFVPCGARSAFLDNNGDHVFVSDGTAAGTTQVPGGGNFGRWTATNLVSFGSDVCFYGIGLVGGVQHTGLWRSNGNNAVLLADLPLQRFTSNNIVHASGRLYLKSFDAALTSSRQLWTSDGTVAGTLAVANLGRGFEHMTPVGGRIAFAADDGRIGAEPWRSDGTAAGTAPIADLQPDPGTGLGSDPAGFFELGATTLFSANDGAIGRELYRTDGTANGTALLADLYPGLSASDPSRLAAAGTRAVFLATPGIRRPIATDGTPGGTAAIPSFAFGYPWDFTDMPDPVTLDAGTAVLFGVYSDVSLTPINMVLRVTSSGASSQGWSSGPKHAPLAPWRLGPQVLFSSGDNTTGRELWSTAGWSVGIRAGNAGSNPGTNLRLEFGNIGLFDADDGIHGVELWSTIGTAAGTALLADLEPGAPGSSPRRGVVAGGLAFFVATTAALGPELWRSDGTANGTFALDLRLGALGSDPEHLVAQHGGVYFAATDSAGDRELWFSDGSVAGTHIVANLAGGSSAPVVLGALGSRRVLLTADDGVNGRELFASDGTAAGTLPFASLRPGNADPGVTAMHLRNDGLVLFAADDGVHGRELFVLDPGAVATATNDGCGSSIAPRVALDDPVLGTAPAMRISSTAPAAFGLLVLGFQRDSLQFGNCRVHVDLALPVSVSILVLPGGTVTSSLPVPAAPSLAGLVLALQVAAGPSAMPGGVDVGNAVRMRLGN